MLEKYAVRWKEQHPNHRAFAILVNNEFAGVWYFHPEVDNPGFLAALASDPKVVEITHMNTIPIAEMGYMWNGVDFDEPEDE